MKKLKLIGAILALAFVACMAAVPQVSATGQTGWTLAGTGWVNAEGGTCFDPNGTGECEASALALCGNAETESMGGGVDDHYFYRNPGHAPVYAGTVTHYCSGLCSEGMNFTTDSAYMAVFNAWNSYSGNPSHSSISISAAAGGMCGSSTHPIPCLMQF